MREKEREAGEKIGHRYRYKERGLGPEKKTKTIALISNMPCLPLAL